MTVDEAYAKRPPAARPERPLRIGLSIGHPNGTCGTLGPFVALSSGKTGFLTAASVAAPKGAKPGDYIHQPSLLDTPTLTGATRAGVLTDLYTVLAASGEYWGDAAFVEALGDAGPVRNVAPPGSAHAGAAIAPSPVEPAETIGSEVVCFGREGPTFGRVAAMLNVRIRADDRTMLFMDCLDVRGDGGAFSFRGDGGALVCRRADLAPIGLVFASARADDDPAPTYVFALAKALAAFGLHLI